MVDNMPASQHHDIVHRRGCRDEGVILAFQWPKQAGCYRLEGYEENAYKGESDEKGRKSLAPGKPEYQQAQKPDYQQCGQGHE
ncbi:hypothetical protein GCM10027342_03100 [Photobacterium alginatilyticum]